MPSREVKVRYVVWWPGGQFPGLGRVNGMKRSRQRKKPMCHCPYSSKSHFKSQMGSMELSFGWLVNEKTRLREWRNGTTYSLEKGLPSYPLAGEQSS